MPHAKTAAAQPNRKRKQAAVESRRTAGGGSR